jgi:hypothetical protein
MAPPRQDDSSDPPAPADLAAALSPLEPPASIIAFRQVSSDGGTGSEAMKSSPRSLVKLIVFVLELSVDSVYPENAPLVSIMA